MSLANRVALVTGGGRGIGQAISLALAEDGASVAVNYRRDEAAANETVDAIEALGGVARAYYASVDQYEEDREMVAAIEADLGAVSILVNNAGIASRGLSVADTDPDELRRVVSTHAFAAHYLSKLVIPGMREQDRGDIIMISSAATKGLGANGAPYNMAKTAQETLAFTLSKEERVHGIRVNITAGVNNLRDLDATMPFGKVCQPEDVANVVRYLVSDKSSYVTGERIYCDGGGPLVASS